MKGKIILPQAWVEASSPSSGGSAPNHMIWYIRLFFRGHAKV
jgi:hypothetical protein